MDEDQYHIITTDDIVQDEVPDVVHKSTTNVEDDVSEIINDIEEFSNEETLTEFLEDILSSLRNETLSDVNRQRLGEFYMECRFNEAKKEKRVEYTEEEMIKFLFLGWFIYRMILKDKRF